MEKVKFIHSFIMFGLHRLLTFRGRSPKNSNSSVDFRILYFVLKLSSMLCEHIVPFCAFHDDLKCNASVRPAEIVETGQCSLLRNKQSTNEKRKEVCVIIQDKK